MLTAAVDLGGSLIGYLIPFLFVLTIVVFFHELGHFLVARWCGVTVRTFSVGFGPELFGFTDRRGTRWRLSAIPLGGYVKFLGDENEASVTDREALQRMTPAEREGAFATKSVGKRAAVVAAGPLANFLLAIIIFAAMAMLFGRETTVARIDTVTPETVAAEAGFRPGDVVRSINGRSVEGYTDVQREIALSGGVPLTFEVDRNGSPVTIVATPELRREADRFGNRQEIGVLDIGGPEMPALIRSVQPGSAAAAAGLQVDDRIVAIDGTAVHSFEDVRRIVSSSPGRPLSLEVDRGGRPLALTATPEPAAAAEGSGTVGRLGIGGGLDEADAVSVRYGPLEAIGNGVSETWFVIDRTFSYLGGVILGQQSADQLGGPIRVAQVSGQVATLGILALINLAAILSISIGLINLFPVPMLDGGHLMFYALEAVRGRPLSDRAQDIGFRIGFAAVVMLMLFATWNDIVHLTAS